MLDEAGVSKQSLQFGPQKANANVAESMAVKKLHCSLSIGSHVASANKRPDTIAKPNLDDENMVNVGRDS